MTKEEAKAWRENWEAVNRFQIEEMRAAPMEKRLADLAWLVELAQNWRCSKPELLRRVDAEIEEVRDRWARLRRAYGV